MLISGFSAAKELSTRANQKISGYNLIPNHSNTLRVDAKFFLSAKKYLRKKNFRIRVDMA